MNNIKVQEQSIYKLLQPVFQSQGYELVAAKNQFTKKTAKGFRSVQFSVSANDQAQILDIYFGVRFDIIETLVQQFLNSGKLFENESKTIIAPLHKLKRAPIQRIIISDKASIQNACNEISCFMEEKGFRFLQAFDRLKRVDAAINRNPQLPCPYMHNQVHRAFKGITIARLLQRNDFERLISTYRNHLHCHWAPPHIIENYDKLVNYLKCFSFN